MWDESSRIVATVRFNGEALLAVVDMNCPIDGKPHALSFKWV